MWRWDREGVSWGERGSGNLMRCVVAAFVGAELGWGGAPYASAAVFRCLLLIFHVAERSRGGVVG